MNEWSTEWQAFSRQQQLLAEARQARLVAQVRAPGDGQPSGQLCNLNAAVQQRPTGSVFDAAVRQLAQRLSRRRLWGVATAVALGAAIGRLPATDARNRNQKRKKAKKIQRNSFGCVDVGKACRGNSANCCSGICQGKKPKKGEKDKSRCVARNVADCQVGQDTCAADGPTDCAEGSGFCFQTTGKASFCAAAFSGACRACTRDTDCEAEFGAGAACAVCAESCGDSLNLCVSPLA